MLARKYNKYIEIWSTSTVADGFGGNTVDTFLAFSFWANVTTKNARILNENGQNDNIVQTIFTIRRTSDIEFYTKSNFIKYNGLTYNIDSIMNLDLNNIDIQIYASQRD
jgi:SPP1 family predicted phage head-tail adaptor